MMSCAGAVWRQDLNSATVLLNSHTAARALMEVVSGKVILNDAPGFAETFAKVKTNELLAMDVKRHTNTERKKKHGNGNGLAARISLNCGPRSRSRCRSWG